MLETEGNGDLKSGSSSCCSTLITDAEKRSDGVYCKGEVADWVEREVRWRRGAGEKGSGWVGGRRWGGSELV